MKEVLVTIKVTINEPEYELWKRNKYTDIQIQNYIRASINSAKVDLRFISDFEVEDIKEVKE